LFAIKCPNTAHAGSHVVRHGFTGSPPHQRYRCEPAHGAAHTFSLPVETIPQSVDEPLPLATIRSYRHDVTEIASALVAIGRGASYRQAALSSSAGSSMNGQLVANWVRVFGPLVTGADQPRRWPALTAVGSFTLQPRPGNDGLVVQIAVGAPRSTAIPRLWDARIASRSPGQWRSFFERHAGAPQILLTQRGSEPATAALRVWSATPPKLIESKNWMRPAVVGHGGPAGIRSTDPGAADLDIDALVHAYADSRDALLRRLAHRRGHFRLPDQVNRLLDLMRLDVNGEAEASDYARLIAFGAVD
jgi:hypothetical protein